LFFEKRAIRFGIYFILFSLVLAAAYSGMNITLLFIEMIENSEANASAVIAGFNLRGYAAIFLVTGAAFLSVTRHNEM
jgi:hypothetical protein